MNGLRKWFGPSKFGSRNEGPEPKVLNVKCTYFGAHAFGAHCNWSTESIGAQVPMEHRAIRSTGYLEPWLRKLRMVRERLEKGATEGGSNGWGQSGKSPGVRQ